MQFFYLVSLVVVASNVAAFPQPAEQFEKHSDSANADLTSDLETRSYQPEFNPQSNSGTLVSLERRGSSQGSSEEDSGSDSSFPFVMTRSRTQQKIKNAIDKAETGSLMLSSIINEVEHSRADASENPGTDENATGGSAKETTVEYLKNALYISTSMKTWVKENRKWMLIVIKSGLNSVEYSKAKSTLKEAGERLAVNVKKCMKAVNDALLAIEKNASPIKLNMETIHASYTQIFDAYRMYLEELQLQLDKFDDDGRTDLVFSAARAMSGNSSRSAVVTPLYNSDGVVQYDPTSILRVMQCHYGSLAADITGHSLDLQYWHDRQPIQVSRDTSTIRNSDIFDQDFSWNQIAAALLQMSPREAPGDDGITTAFYQAALYMPANTQEGVPPTPFARALLRVCGQVFASATIPRAWLCASIVSIDKKDGDPLNPGDKRGIALINVGLKLVCKVLQMRIERFVETNNLLSYEQAGFRKREECVGQVVSLIDIIQRRQNAGLNTHVLFIDIRKAFDTVPVGALLWKLQNMGFPRRTLAFLKALYTSSSARARADSLLSDPFPVQRGVRQGCPLSGLLFNLFINDILDGVAPITVPGLSRDTNPIRGLMYADDVAVFADSEQSLLAASTAIEQWANRWEMQFGVAKCGIISFTGHLAPRLDSPLDIRLHGQLVSRVESYKYLGVLIDSKLDHSAWLKQKRSALEHTISALHPVLANHQLTVNYQSRIFSAVVMGKAYYGLELIGGNKSHLAPLQTTINKDNDVFTLNVQGQLVRSQRWFWSRRTKQLYRNRYWLTPQIRPKTVKQRHSFALMETLRTCGDSVSLQNNYSAHPFAHLVVECEQVTGHRIQSGLVPAIQKSRLRLLGRALDPGVENVYTWLRGEVINGEADLDQRWLDGTVEHEFMGTRHDNRALAARLAEFL
ncbi:hypothetical protein BASA50_010514 [Batrachochytrium salamandrivorans]|uniref:Reverse transcriptase domain-containing protein n=1 Tax=Batrachochytrium salamandrivorans TaxID=1357716 RepID=A0ABQ8EYQ0_9FUNG|nr:hypothetical protein BASA50_010514 [Batrachochytrium salamandrivorans]